MSDVKVTSEPLAEHPELMTSCEEYLKGDTRTVPDICLERSTRSDLPSPRISKESMLSRDYARAEYEKIWYKVWQMACRERELPDVGSYVEYEIGDQSILVVRGEDRQLRAYHNVCLHRGTRLAKGSGCASDLTCTFHGWSWNLDGSLRRVPCRWDFPTVEDGDYGLPEVKLETWNGFVFVNFDPDAAPLREYLGETVIRHFETWPLDRRVKVAHVAKPFNCNWKAAVAAFVELYHAFRTHPQTALYTADANAAYDQYGLHSREVGVMGAASPHLEEPVDDQTVVDAMIRDTLASGGVQFDLGDYQIPEVGEGQTSRSVLADWVRETVLARQGVDHQHSSDSEMLDIYQYYIFPNFLPWGGFSFPFVYRVRPMGDDPDWCFWEIMMLAEVPEGVELPPEAPINILRHDQLWAEAPELAGVGPVFDQDTENMEKVQAGLKSRGLSHIVLAEYQESSIRQMFLNVSLMMGGLEPEARTSVTIRSEGQRR